MEIIAKHCGCLPCLLKGISDVHTTVEHVTEAGRRVGNDEQHQWTIGLCVWHHFGRTSSSAHRNLIIQSFGPCLADGRKPFEDYFGDEVQVLVPTQDFMLAEFDAQPWPEYSVPRKVAHRVRKHWRRLHHALPANQFDTS